jgi:hypothetical protein
MPKSNMLVETWWDCRIVEVKDVRLRVDLSVVETVAYARRDEVDGVAESGIPSER